ncbi:MAG: ABC transporter ATP-binding protein [Candidatus Bathyarchaeota archaeon]|nr:MAG: ABC transporter ATP-binding protein [Candidatus Bathyarchaeota archaeon]
MDRALILRAVDLSKTYSVGKIHVPVLNKINLELERGDLAAIQGPSGSGKTTLLNMLGGLDTPTSGEVWIERLNIALMKERELSRIRCRKIGFVFQFYNLIPNMSALYNVELPMIFAGTSKHKRRQKALSLLKTVGLADKLSNCPHELSAGEQQRIAVARALANDPALVLMDEPTGNLDKENTTNIISLIRELNNARAQTFVLTTHDPMITECAQKKLTLHHGKITQGFKDA